MDNEIRPRKSMGGSGIHKVSGQGSSASSFLFYFLPDTEGRAYVVMIRHEDYANCYACAVRVSNSNTGYDETQYAYDVDSFLHRMQFDGLETNTTYKIQMVWYKKNGSEHYLVEIERTYYCNNETPSEAPGAYYDTIEVPNYKNSFPKYCLNIRCPENENQLNYINNKVDGRCPYEATTRDLFWRVCATNYETHPIASAMEAQPTIRWPAGTVYVAVTYLDHTWDTFTQNCSDIYNRIQEWISWMNGITEDFGVHFELGSTKQKNGKQISVFVGTHEQLWPDVDLSQNDIYISGGSWESVSWGDGILESRVKICCESRYPWCYVSDTSPPAFEGIVFEELTEACGPRYDQFGINNTIFSEFSYPTKSLGGPEGEPRERDENVVRILYSLGYLKGETAAKTEDSEYDTGIKFDKIYYSYGPLKSSSPDLFFQINVSCGNVVEDYTSLPDWIGTTFKSDRNYYLSAIYATEVPETQKEKYKNLSFRYSNPSSESNLFNLLPLTPQHIVSKKVNSGYVFEVSGLSDSAEEYYIQAWMKNLTDEDIDNDSYRNTAWVSYAESSIRVVGLQYGRKYDFYLYAVYDNTFESDWVYIGDGVIPPKQPKVYDIRNTDTSISFSYDMGNTLYDRVVYELYKNGNVFLSGSLYNNQDKIDLYFEKSTAQYELKVYSVITFNGVDVQCVDDNGNPFFVTYSFKVLDRVQFYWSDAVESNKPVVDVLNAEWNGFVTNIRDTVCLYLGINNIIPSNSSIYASGFGLAAGKSFENALMLYAIMPEDGNRELSAERFNIVNYIINYCKTTNISYKYKKTVQQCEVIADELIQLQNILNSL